MTRPGVLRRVAGLFAARIPACTDRIVATGVGSQVLGTAISLTTGLPFVALGGHNVSAATGGGAPPAAPPFGYVHRGETVALVSVFAQDGDEIAAYLAENRLTVATWQVVLAPMTSSVNGQIGQLHGLFTLDESGTISIRKDSQNE